MIRRLATLVAVLACATPASAHVTGPVDTPPGGPGQSASLIFDAMLAIGRAQLANPHGAQAATFSYAQALQRYRAGDRDAASAAALQAIAQAGTVPYRAPAVPSPVPLFPPAASLPRYGALPPGATPSHVDADAFLALARTALQQCPAAHLAAAREAYVHAAQAALKADATATRAATTAAIDDCAAR